MFKKTYFDGFSDKKYLTDEEFDCLLIEKGNLTKSERKIMQDHIIHTENLLNRLKFPEKLKNVPIYANAHHESIATEEVTFAKEIYFKNVCFP